MSNNNMYTRLNLLLQSIVLSSIYRFLPYRISAVSDWHISRTRCTPHHTVEGSVPVMNDDPMCDHIDMA
jgi:hypothetical protein